MTDSPARPSSRALPSARALPRRSVLRAAAWGAPVIAAAVVSALPAIMAYRQPPAAALRD